jgi:hypothetical protein
VNSPPALAQFTDVKFAFPLHRKRGEGWEKREGTVRTTTQKRFRDLGGLVFLAAIIAALISFAQAQPANGPQNAPHPAQIDRNGVIILIRESLLALDQANKTGNYTVLRDLGAPAFQANSAARLSEIFAKQRNDNIDLSGVAVIDPQLTLLPQIEGNGLLHMTGFFPRCRRK